MSLTANPFALLPTCMPPSWRKQSTIAMWPSDPEQNSTLVQSLSVLLHEPCRVVRRLVQQHQRYHAQLEYRRHHRLAKSVLQDYANTFFCPQQDAYHRLVAEDSRARILAAFHFGDFVYGMNCLVSRISHRGETRVLTLERGTQASWHNIRVAFGEHAPNAGSEMLRHRTSTSNMSGFLRKPGNTLVLFSDLPAGCGAVSKVHFLSRPAWFPRGPATLAVFNRVPLVPVICVKHSTHNVIYVGTQIEPAGYSGIPKNDHIAHITQLLVNVLERFFIRYPEQWRYLSLLPQYFDSSLSNQL